MFQSQHLSVLSVLSALTAVSLAAPKPKPQDWNAVDWNNIGVDWNTVNYGGGASPVPATTQVQVEATTQPPVVATPPVTTAPTTSAVIPSTPTPTPSPSSSSSSGSGSGSGSGSSTPSGGKRGLAYNSSSSSLDIFDSYSSIGWGWDWDSARGELPSKYEFVPMMWSPDHSDQFDKDFNSAPASYVLSFNEPDIGGQAKMQVGDAVSQHASLMNKYAGKAKIGAVSVSNGKSDDPANPMGLDYLKAFMDGCTTNSEPCVIDFCPVHWYGCTSESPCSVDVDIDSFKTQMTNAISTCPGKPVWITEFQRLGSMEDQQSFVTKAIEWLDQPEQSAIERYSYFMVMDGSLTNGNSLSNVGTAYVSG